MEVDAIQTYETSLDDVDFRVPTVQVEFAGKVLREVLLNGGSRVNILLSSIYFKLGSPKLRATPFQVKMADQRRLQPTSILKDQTITVATLLFNLNLVVLNIQFDEDTYPMLLGRPWFKIAKLKQDWGSNTILIK